MHEFLRCSVHITKGYRLSSHTGEGGIYWFYNKGALHLLGKLFRPGLLQKLQPEFQTRETHEQKHAPSVMKEIADGIFITLTSSPMDYDTEECWQKRAKLMNCMGI